MVAGPPPVRLSPQGTASVVIAPQRIAGRRHRGGVAGGDVAGGHGRDQRAAGGVDHPPGAGGARPRPLPTWAGRASSRSSRRTGGAPSRPGSGPGPPRPHRRRAPRPATRQRGPAASDDGGRAGVVAAVQRRPARRQPAVVRTPPAEPPVVREPSPKPPVARPSPRPVRPPRPRPVRPEPGSPPRSWRRPTGHKPHPGKRPRVPSVPRPGKPRTADPDDGSTCPGGPRERAGTRTAPAGTTAARTRTAAGGSSPSRDEGRPGRGRPRAGPEAGDPGEQGRGHDEQEGADRDGRASRDVEVTDR